MPAALRASVGCKRLISGSGRGYALLGRRRRVPCSGGLLRGGTARAIHVERALGARPMPRLIAEGKPHRQPAGGPQSMHPRHCPNWHRNGRCATLSCLKARAEIVERAEGRLASNPTPAPPPAHCPRGGGAVAGLLRWAPFPAAGLRRCLQWPVCSSRVVFLQQATVAVLLRCCGAGGRGNSRMRACARVACPSLGALHWACCCNPCYVRHCSRSQPVFTTASALVGHSRWLAQPSWQRTRVADRAGGLHIGASLWAERQDIPGSHALLG